MTSIYTKFTGLVDLAEPVSQNSPPGTNSRSESVGPSAFRRSAWFDALSGGLPPGASRPEVLAWQVKVDGTILIDPGSPRAVRYQAARFAQFETHTPGGYQYRITPASLEIARSQNLKTSHLINLLRKYPTTTPIHPGLFNALERWEKLGVQTKMEKAVILRVNAPEVLSLLKQNKRSARYLGELLNPTTILVKPAGRQVILETLIEAGYLLEYDLE